MIDTWIHRKIRNPNSNTFVIYDLAESKPIDNNIIQYLSEKTLANYRNIKWLKERLQLNDEIAIREYLRNNVFPSTVSQITKNVRQGDFGEILSTLIIEKFQNLKVPISKLRYKFNKDRSVFCTDLISINKGEVITDIKYYEVKTRITYSKDTIKKAYEGLLKDEKKPNETIADFLDRLYFEKAESLHDAGNINEANKYYAISKQFGEIVKDPSSFNRSFEIILIIEKDKFNEEMIHELNRISLELDPLEISLFLVENLNDIVTTVFQNAEEVAVDLIKSA